MHLKTFGLSQIEAQKSVFTHAAELLKKQSWVEVG